jgi:hypothetical protein
MNILMSVCITIIEQQSELDFYRTWASYSVYASLTHEIFVQIVQICLKI